MNLSTRLRTLSFVTPSPLQLMSATQLLIPIGKDDDFTAIQKRLFSIGAGWVGSSLGSLSQEIESVHPEVLMVKDSGEISVVMLSDDIDSQYPNALPISSEDLLSVSLSNFKKRIYNHQQKEQRKRDFRESLKLIEQIPESELTDEVMAHMSVLREIAESRIS